MNRSYTETPRPRRWAAVLLASASAIAVLGSGSALASTGGAPAPGGTTPPATTPTTPAVPTTTSGYVFPIRGPHTFGQGFGAARAGHSHEGQDIMAACGTPLVAASRSVVRFRGRQGAAGNYIVLRDLVSGQDFAYMHLLAPAPVIRGQRLTAGQAVGNVGRTGDATACHLHFELWLAPGWYRGGKPTNPLPVLQGWDAIS
jgi:murein DD-endopeptidase MepM/ murein hydrolase activator NlpD